jgi:proline iminopeptidase
LTTFEPHYLGTQEGTLVWYTYGDPDKPPLLFLNGGPGDDHRYLRPVAGHYVDSFYCVLFDQRGCGDSVVNAYNSTNLHIDHFMADIDRLRRYLRQDKIALLGHSWGATLALYYGAFYPDKVQSMVLVGMGPLTPDNRKVAGANLLKPLNEAERQALSALKNERDVTYAAKDWEAHARIQIEIVTRYSVRAWFYSPEAAARFAQDYAAHYNYNPRVAPYLLPTVRAIDILSQLEGHTFPAQVVYGYQDFEPITQAYQLREVLPSAELLFLHETGHVPWYEQPDTFYNITSTFLKAHT